MRGRVAPSRLSAEASSVEVLPAIVAGLRQQHPQLKVELVLTNRVQDLLRREADIAVRMTDPKQDSLIARRVGHVVLGLHAHKNYIAQRGTPRKPDDLAQHSLSVSTEETPFIRAASKALPGWTRRALSLRTDSDIAQMALIRSGCGIGYARCRWPSAIHRSCASCRGSSSSSWKPGLQCMRTCAAALAARRPSTRLSRDWRRTRVKEQARDKAQLPPFDAAFFPPAQYRLPLGLLFDQCRGA